MDGCVLFDVDYALFSVGVERGFLDDIVEVSWCADFDEVKGRIGLVLGDEGNGSDSEDAIDKGAVEFEVDDAEHIEVVDLAAEYASCPFDPIGGDFVADALEHGDFIGKKQ